MEDKEKKKSSEGSKKTMVAEYLKARVGKTPYEGPTGDSSGKEGKKRDPEMKKESKALPEALRKHQIPAGADLPDSKRGAQKAIAMPGKTIPGMKKESMEMKMCEMCKEKKCPPGMDCCKACSKVKEGMDKESAVLFVKAVDLLKQAMTPPPGAAPQGGPPMPPQGGPQGGPPMPPQGGPQGGPPMPPQGGGAPGGLLPLPLLLQQLQVYMMMQQQQQGGGGGMPGA